MDLILRRTRRTEAGIFSTLLDSSGNQIAVCLEHAYPVDDFTVSPKIPDGMYLCVKGMHQLEHSPAPFETFEITEVPGHTNILFHIGNTQADSSGCVLLGEEIEQVMGVLGISNSGATFNLFMELQDGCESFALTVD